MEMKKKDLKKILCLLLACCVLFSLAACGGDTSGNDGGNTNTPGSGVSTPNGGSSTPSNETNTPAGEPSTPAGEPSAPAGEPSTPAGEPSTPAGEPSTPADTEPEPTEAVLPTQPPAHTGSKDLVFEPVTSSGMWGGYAGTSVRTSTMLPRDFDMGWFVQVSDISSSYYGDDRLHYRITMDGDCNAAVQDGGFSLTYELFDIHTGVVMAISMNDTSSDEYGRQIISGAYTIEYDGNTYDITFDLSSSLDRYSFTLIYEVVMPQGYDGLGIVLAYSNMAMEEAYEHLMGTNATLDDYGIFDRPDYKFFRVSDFFAEG